MSTDQPEADQPEGDQTGAGEPGAEPDEATAAAVATDGDDGGNGGEGEPSRPAELEAGPPAVDPVRDRLLLPLFLPILAIVAVALYVLNLSRVFLAGGNGAGSVIIASIVTVAILAGAAVLSSMPQLRSSTLTMTVTLLIVIVMGAGMITLGPSEEHGEGGEGGYREPAGDPTSMLEVDALPSLQFQSDQFTVPGGILQIDYIGQGGSHTLVFEEAEFAGFKLTVNGEETDDGKVEIGTGDYTIFCDIPGHRAAGMEALLTITPPPPGAAPQPGPEGVPEPPATDAP